MHLSVCAMLRYSLLRLTKKKKNEKPNAGVSINQKGARRIHSERVHFDRMSSRMRGLGRGKTSQESQVKLND